MVMFFADDHLFKFHSIRPEDVKLPCFENIWNDHFGERGSMHEVKKPRCFSLHRIKKNKVKYFYRFETKSKVDKKTKKGKVKPENLSKQAKYSKKMAFYF